MDEDIRAIHEKLDELQAMLWRVKVLANWILGAVIVAGLLWLLDGLIKAMD